MLCLLRREEEGSEISPLWAWEGSAPAQTFTASRVLCCSLLPPALAQLQHAGNLQPLRSDLISRVSLVGWSVELLVSGGGEGALDWAGRALPRTGLQLGMGQSLTLMVFPRVLLVPYHLGCKTVRSHVPTEICGRPVLKLFHPFPLRLFKQVPGRESPKLMQDGGEGSLAHRWLIPPLPSFLAPSAVPTMHLHSSTGNSMTLSWTPPERPNGIILDYEIKYSEKVKQEAEQPFPSSNPSSKKGPCRHSAQGMEGQQRGDYFTEVTPTCLPYSKARAMASPTQSPARRTLCDWMG